MVARVLFGGLADEPGGNEAVASLTVGGQHRRTAADLDGVEWTGCAAAVVGDDAGFGVDRADRAIPQIDDLD